mgnify:CR=1 FL=1
MKSSALVFSCLAVSAIIVAIIVSPGIQKAIYTHGQIDTIGHFIAFFCLSWIIYGGIKLELKTTVIGLSVYGALTELGQLFLGFRNAEWSDFYADVAGTVLFALIIWLKRRFILSYKKNN